MKTHLDGAEKVTFSVSHNAFRIVLIYLALLYFFHSGLVSRSYAAPGQDPIPLQSRSQDPPPALKKTPSTSETLDGPWYEVSRFTVGYVEPHPDLPSIDEIMNEVLHLGQKAGCYVAEAEGQSPLSLRLSDLPDLGVQKFHHSAIQSINSQMVAFLNRKGLVGISAAPSTLDIDETGKDIRPLDVKALHLEITAAMVESVRTQALGTRFPASDGIDNSAHERIKKLSPIFPAAPNATERHDLIRKNLLDAYLYRLNRHPGRRIDVAIAPGETLNRIQLDYLVTEKKPWLAYLQGSNTGTTNTKDWRWRFGFVHNQLLNRDDILSLDYITTDFDSPESSVLLGTYEAPLFDSETIRWSLFGLLSRFKSSQVGVASESFRGRTQKLGGELFINVHQNNDFFTDLILGLRQEKFEVRNKTILIDGNETLLFPEIGIRFEQRAEQASTSGRMVLEKMTSDAKKEELTRLGRLDPDTGWLMLKGNMTYAFFLEPLLNRSAWEDVNTPDSSTLAHEMAITLSGQHTFGKRVIPQFQGVLGGAYSVRGYPTSAVAGDSSLVTSLEYRYHFPRGMAIEPDPSRTPLFGESFRFAPQQVYGRPDWDLVFRAFVDAGKTWNADILSVIEKDETPIGTGVGLEFVFKNNISIRADWGIALIEVNKGMDDEVKTGDSRFHLALTVLF
ncbi:MAG: ShlB/FhaC/HecB family hemolysin secretion/activation protein [Planctomycetota bacterium]